MRVAEQQGQWAGQSMGDTRALLEVSHFLGDFTNYLLILKDLNLRQCVSEQVEHSSRLSAEELDRERGRELRDWKEQRVDEAVALIRVSAFLTSDTIHSGIHVTLVCVYARALACVLCRRCSAKLRRRRCNSSRREQPKRWGSPAII